ncbi:MAG: response regulator [Anaerolineaceae bacterium]|nr:response regulator [Anaerolineaceae bacterium]
MDKWHVLIVEDEIDGQEVVEAILGYFNISADAVGTAEDALHLLNQNQYTAAVIDLGLPGMDGIELISAMRNDSTYAQLPCVAITAFHSSQLKQQALAAGFDAYFAKPLDDTSFVRELDRIISRN